MNIWGHFESEISQFMHALCAPIMASSASANSVVVSGSIWPAQVFIREEEIFAVTCMSQLNGSDDLYHNTLCKDHNGHRCFCMT